MADEQIDDTEQDQDLQRRDLAAVQLIKAEESVAYDHTVANVERRFIRDDEYVVHAPTPAGGTMFLQGGMHGTYLHVDLKGDGTLDTIHVQFGGLMTITDPQGKVIAEIDHSKVAEQLGFAINRASQPGATVGDFAALNASIDGTRNLLGIPVPQPVTAQAATNETAPPIAEATLAPAVKGVTESVAPAVASAVATAVKGAPATAPKVAPAPASSKTLDLNMYAANKPAAAADPNLSLAQQIDANALAAVTGERLDKQTAAVHNALQDEIVREGRDAQGAAVAQNPRVHIEAEGTDASHAAIAVGNSEQGPLEIHASADGEVTISNPLRGTQVAHLHDAPLASALIEAANGQDDLGAPLNHEVEGVVSTLSNTALKEANPHLHVLSPEAGITTRDLPPPAQAQAALAPDPDTQSTGAANTKLKPQVQEDITPATHAPAAQQNAASASAAAPHAPIAATHAPVQETAHVDAITHANTAPAAETPVDPNKHVDAGAKYHIATQADYAAIAPLHQQQAQPQTQGGYAQLNAMIAKLGFPTEADNIKPSAEIITKVQQKLHEKDASVKVDGKYDTAFVGEVANAANQIGDFSPTRVPDARSQAQKAAAQGTGVSH